MDLLTERSCEQSEHKKAHNSLVATLNKFQQFKMEAKPHVKNTYGKGSGKAGKAAKAAATAAPDAD